MHYIYIIYSTAKNAFYIGETMDIRNRIEEHNSNIHNLSFTRRANDWQLFFFIECESKSQAQKIERHIKKMKSRKYYHNLKKYPNISSTLLEKYRQ